MKLLVTVLFVAVVAGNIFHQPFWPLVKPSWQTMSSKVYQPLLSNKGYYYYPTQTKECGQHQDYFPFYDYFPYYPYTTEGGFSDGQQRSPAVKKNDRVQSVKDWQRNPVESKAWGQRSRWNQKFFLLDNEAQTVHALRPFNPLEMFSYQLSQMKPSSPLTRPMFARRTVTETITETDIKTDTKFCIPSHLFISPSVPTICPTYAIMKRHFKNYDDLLEDYSILPTSISAVEPTVLTIQSQQSPVYAIESSKDEDLNEKRDFGYYDLEGLTRKNRAMFGSPSTTMVTVVWTRTSFVTQPVSPVLPSSGGTGPLICVPPGLVVCV